MLMSRFSIVDAFAFSLKSRRRGPPVFIDEIQKAPILFEQMKLLIDKSRKRDSSICAALSSSK